MAKEMNKTIELLRAARKNLLDAMYTDTIDGEQVLSLEEFNKLADMDDAISEIITNLLKKAGEF